MENDTMDIKYLLSTKDFNDSNLLQYLLDNMQSSQIKYNKFKAIKDYATTDKLVINEVTWIANNLYSYLNDELFKIIPEELLIKNIKFILKFVLNDSLPLNLIKDKLLLNNIYNIKNEEINKAHILKPYDYIGILLLHDKYFGLIKKIDNIEKIATDILPNHPIITDIEDLKNSITISSSNIFILLKDLIFNYFLKNHSNNAKKIKHILTKYNLLEFVNKYCTASFKFIDNYKYFKEKYYNFESVDYFLEEIKTQANEYINYNNKINNVKFGFDGYILYNNIKNISKNIEQVEPSDTKILMDNVNDDSFIDNIANDLLYNNKLITYIFEYFTNYFCITTTPNILVQDDVSIYDKDYPIMRISGLSLNNIKLNLFYKIIKGINDKKININITVNNHISKDISNFINNLLLDYYNYNKITNSEELDIYKFRKTLCHKLSLKLKQHFESHFFLLKLEKINYYQNYKRIKQFYNFFKISSIKNILNNNQQKLIPSKSENTLNYIVIFFEDLKINIFCLSNFELINNYTLDYSDNYNANDKFQFLDKDINLIKAIIQEYMIKLIYIEAEGKFSKLVNDQVLKINENLKIISKINYANYCLFYSNKVLTIFNNLLNSKLDVINNKLIIVSLFINNPLYLALVLYNYANNKFYYNNNFEIYTDKVKLLLCYLILKFNFYDEDFNILFKQLPDFKNIKSSIINNYLKNTASLDFINKNFYMEKVLYIDNLGTLIDKYFINNKSIYEINLFINCVKDCLKNYIVINKNYITHINDIASSSGILYNNVILLIYYYLKLKLVPFNRKDYKKYILNDEYLITKIYNSEIKYEKIMKMKITELKNNFLKGTITADFIARLFYVNIKIGDTTIENYQDAKKYFSKNEIINVKIKKINVEDLKLEVSLNESELKNYKSYIDKYKIFSKYGLEEGDNFVINNSDAYAPPSKLYVKDFTIRDIKHEKFYNINKIQSKNMLVYKELFSYLFRPITHTSANTSNNLLLDMKVNAELIVSIVIIDNFFNVVNDHPQNIYIGDDYFEDLNDIENKYIIKIKNFISSVVNHKNYIDKCIFAYDDNIVEENEYKLCFYKSFSNIFVLICYKSFNNCFEKIEVCYRGFKFHNIYFSNIDQVVSYWKNEHIKIDYNNFLKKYPNLVISKDNEDVIEIGSDNGDNNSEIEVVDNAVIDDNNNNKDTWNKFDNNKSNNDNSYGYKKRDNWNNNNINKNLDGSFNDKNNNWKNKSNENSNNYANNRNNFKDKNRDDNSKWNNNKGTNNWNNNKNNDDDNNNTWNNNKGRSNWNNNGNDNSNNNPNWNKKKNNNDWNNKHKSDASDDDNNNKNNNNITNNWSKKQNDNWGDNKNSTWDKKNDDWNDNSKKNNDNNNDNDKSNWNSNKNKDDWTNNNNTSDWNNNNKNNNWGNKDNSNNNWNTTNNKNKDNWDNNDNKKDNWNSKTNNDNWDLNNDTKKNDWNNNKKNKSNDSSKNNNNDWNNKNKNNNWSNNKTSNWDNNNNIKKDYSDKNDDNNSWNNKKKDNWNNNKSNNNDNPNWSNKTNNNWNKSNNNENNNWKNNVKKDYNNNWNNKNRNKNDSSLNTSRNTYNSNNNKNWNNNKNSKHNNNFNKNYRKPSISDSNSNKNTNKNWNNAPKLNVKRENNNANTFDDDNNSLNDWGTKKDKPDNEWV